MFVFIQNLLYVHRYYITYNMIFFKFISITKEREYEHCATGCTNNFKNCNENTGYIDAY